MILNRCFAVIAGLSLLSVAPLASADPSGSSVQGDGTTGTQVLSDYQRQVYEISGGTQIDQNLLHSFLTFSVEDGWTAAFRPFAPSVTNIIARITGSDISTIDGLLLVDRVGHPVNLFLINPNGIVFGPGAKLDLSGSFVASTADSVKFSEGYGFSARNPAPPVALLTLGVPIGLQFGSAPAPIVGNFIESGSGLIVQEGQTLALVGGDINLQGSGQDFLDVPSFLFAPNGRIEIGSVGAGETVRVQGLGTPSSLTLDFSGVQRFQDISIANGMVVLGPIGTYLYGRQIYINESQIGGFSSPEAEESTVTVKASELLDLYNSIISSSTFSSLPGGTIDIETKILRLSAGSEITTDTFDIDIGAFNAMPGQAGNIFVKAKQVVLSDESTISSSAFTLVPSQAGNISIETEALVLRNQSNISTSSFFSGNGGNITINAGVVAAVPSEDSNISTNAVIGNGGKISITTQGLFGIFPNTEDFSTSSDITARSQFGLNGTVDTNIVSSNPVVNPVKLPALLDNKILETACFGNRRSDRDRFIYSGRGGLPTTPSDLAQSMAVWQDLRAFPPLNEPKHSENRILTPPSTQTVSARTPIIEAQRWVFEPDGSVRLVASPSSESPPSQFCQAARAMSAQPPVVSASGR